MLGKNSDTSESSCNAAGVSHHDGMDEEPAKGDASGRLLLIEQISQSLSTAQSVEEIADVILAEGLPVLGANAGSVALLNQQTQQMFTIRCSGYPPELVAAYRTYPVTTHLPNADVVRSQESLFIETTEERDAFYPHLGDPTKSYERGALAAIPLIAAGRVIGGLAVSFAGDRRFDTGDRAFIQAMGQIGAQALARQQEIDVRLGAERALRHSEARKDAILTSALDCIITIDQDQKVIDWNPAAERTFGYSHDQAVGEALSTLIIPERMHAAHMLGFRHYLATGEGPLLFKRIEVVAVRADGQEILVELAILPVKLDSQIFFTAYLRDLSERESMIAQQRTFLHDILLSVTDGTLRLCYNAGDLPATLPHDHGLVDLITSNDVARVRHFSQQAATQLGFSDERRQDLATAASEAAMNAFTHAGGGKAGIASNGNTVQITISDHGKGISLEHLPQATLTRGYSTLSTLGHGMKFMIETIDRLYLLTNAKGTIVVLEQDRNPPSLPWL